MGSASVREHSADFSDCLHVALARRAPTLLWTFDRKAGRIDGAQLLGR
jgi:predicted nucleic acid-binding protein